MVALELLIDASGAERGAAQATRALGSVTAGAQAAERSISGVSRAFSGASSIASAANGIGAVAASFQNLNIASAAFQGGNVLLNLGRASADFAQLGGRVGTVASAFARLNPYIAGATLVLSGISAGMQLFGRDTDATADSLDGLLGKLDELNIRRAYGQADPRTSVSGTRDTLTQLRLSQRTEPFTIAKAADLFGVSELEFRNALEARIGPRATAGETIRNRFAPGGSSYSYSLTQVSPDETIAAGEALFGQRQFQEGASERLSRAENRARAERSRLLRDEAEERRRIQSEQLERSIELARELEESGRRWGEAVGDGAADLVLGLRNAREVASGLLQDLVRTGLREATGSLFGAVARSFGENATQRGSTPPTPPGIVV